MTSPTKNDQPNAHGIVVLTSEQLEEIVERAAARGAKLALQSSASPAELSPMMTPRMAAKALATSERQILKLIERGDLPATKVGARWRIRRTDLDGLLRGSDAA